MTLVGLLLVAAAFACCFYAFVGYPALLALLARGKRAIADNASRELPSVSIVLPAFNEESAIRGALDAILEADYPRDKLQVLVVSDASTDRTDEVVAAIPGVELLRLPARGGKTAAENAARPHLRGEIIINTDASVRIDPRALRPLVEAFRDPTVGVASGRDVSVAGLTEGVNAGETGYVGYEMWVREVESRVYGIVGASGCFYATRCDLHMTEVPEALSRDFAAPLIAREHGYRSVSVRDARCYVPRTGSLPREYRRKVRTMTRGLGTLFFKRHLLNPFRYGVFAWMLWSHKLIRWLVPWALAMAAAGISLVAIANSLGGWLAVIGLVVIGASVLGWMWPPTRRAPRVIASAAYVCLGVLAGLLAWVKAIRGELNPIWEPTRR